MCYTCAMVKTLELAIKKAANLSEAAQEQIGRELLERIETLQLRTEIEGGVRELDAGFGEDLDIEDVIRQAHEEHANKP
jgi:alcohol dehydrogenase class IV